MPYRKPKVYKHKVRSARKGKALGKEMSCVNKLLKKGHSDTSAIKICKANEGIGHKGTRARKKPRDQRVKKRS